MMDIMVKVGESKYDNYGRITCSIKIAELLELVKGEDVVEWHVHNGEVILRKRTRSYYGFDLESQDIRNRLISYEEDHMEEAMEQALADTLAQVDGVSYRSEMWECGQEV